MLDDDAAVEVPAQAVAAAAGPRAALVHGGGEPLHPLQPVRRADPGEARTDDGDAGRGAGLRRLGRVRRTRGRDERGTGARDSGGAEHVAARRRPSRLLVGTAEHVGHGDAGALRLTVRSQDPPDPGGEGGRASVACHDESLAIRVVGDECC